MKMKKWSKSLLAGMAAASLFSANAYAETVNGNSQIGTPREIQAVYVKDAAVASSQANVSGSSPGTVFRFVNEQVTLTGVDRTQHFFYNVPKAQIGDNSYLQLDISYSDLLVPAKSTLTVLIDDKPVKSLFLTGESGSQRMIKIPLGKDELQAGFHKISLAKHSVVSDDLCSDQDNPANWLKIAPTSFVFLDTKTTWTSSDMLKEFPYPFIEPGMPEEVYGAVVVPDTASAELLSAVLQLTASLSAMTSTGRTLPIMTESEWNKGSAFPHILAVGSIGDWRGPVKKLVEENRLKAEKGSMSLDYFTVSRGLPNESKRLLLVSGDTDQVIQEKIRILAEPVFVRQLSGNHLVVKETPSQPAPKADADSLTLASFGYDHLLLDEVNQQSDRLYAKVPSFWKVTGESWLDLKVKISPLLQNEAREEKPGKPDARPNGLTVKVNGIPTTIALSDLLKDPAEGDTYSVKIPLTQALQEQKGSVLELSFTANIAETGGACYREQNSGKWIFVDKGSAFHIPHELIKENSFFYWPSPFATDKGLENTAVLVPKEVNSTLLTQLSALANALTSDANPQTGLTVFREPLDPERAGELKNYNIIVIGPVSQFPELQAHADNLIVRTENGQLLLGKFGVIDETADYAAWIQPSVWNEEKSLAVFQAVGEQGKEKGSFLHPDMLSYLENERRTAQILVMSKSKEIVSIPLEQVPRSPQTAEAGLDQKTSYPVWLIALVPILFAALLAIFIRMWRKQKQDRQGDK
jgi:hypothetical protein